MRAGITNTVASAMQTNTRAPNSWKPTGSFKIIALEYVPITGTPKVEMAARPAEKVRTERK